MMKLKLAAASLASLAIIAMTPLSAYALGPSCTACYGSCLDAYNGNDTMLSQCFNSCVDGDGILCGATPGA